jgi:AraC-like DNA-binding protein
MTALAVGHRPAERATPPAVESARCAFDLSETRGDPFSGHLEVVSLGPIRICRIHAGQHERPWDNDNDRYARAPFLKIAFQTRGVAQLRQGERRTVLRPNTWAMYDASRAYAVEHIEPLDQWSILIPREIKSPEIELALRNTPDASLPISGLSSILFDSARSAFAEADFVDPAMRESLGGGILEFAKLALFDRLAGSDRIPMVDTFREKVKRYVVRNLGDSELSVDSIAEGLACSKRYLHKGFAQSGATLSQFIWDERLERTRRDLASPALANRSITEISFNWGFVNSAHFSRRFKGRYGISPREFRQMASR